MDIFICDRSIFCQFDFRTVEDAGPYNAWKDAFSFLRTYRQKNGLISIIACDGQKKKLSKKKMPLRGVSPSAEGDRRLCLRLPQAFEKAWAKLQKRRRSFVPHLFADIVSGWSLYLSVNNPRGLAAGTACPQAHKSINVLYNCNIYVNLLFNILHYIYIYDIISCNYNNT